MAASVTMPRLLYGTAWKKERTTELVYKAIKSGFRGIDTAAQPKHYEEALVSEGIRKAIDEGIVTRDELFIQTKFTSLEGQDRSRMPYDAAMSLPEQVHTSVASSLKNFGLIDSLVLHGPLRTHEDTMTVWEQMQVEMYSGKVGQLGVSNFYDLNQLQSLYNAATVKPKVIQNRFYADTGYDVDIRDFCSTHDVKYQSFWSLTANPHLVNNPLITTLAQHRNNTNEQVFYRLLMDMGITPLSGTTDERHMQEDIAVLDQPLTTHEVKKLVQYFRLDK